MAMTCVKGSPRERNRRGAGVTVGVGECYPAPLARERAGCPHNGRLVHRSVDNHSVTAARHKDSQCTCNAPVLHRQCVPVGTLAVHMMDAGSDVFA
jgi:hypothetical protein